MLDYLWGAIRGVPLGTWIALGALGATLYGWRVSWQAQRRLFLFQVKNAARADLAKALRAQEDALRAVTTQLRILHTAQRFPGNFLTTPEKFVAFMENLRTLVSADQYQGLTALEEYEVLFPGTAVCRKELVARRILLFSDTMALCAIAHPDFGQEHRVPGLVERYGNEQALTEDLLVYIQNATLGEIVGHSVPYRDPPDRRVPRIEVRANGVLEIVEGERE